MGYERSEQFERAADQLRVPMPSARELGDVANELSGKTDGSPIGAEAERLASEADGPDVAYAPGPKFDEFIQMILGHFVAQAVAQSDEEEADLANEAAAEAFATAQRLDQMYAGAERMSDELEMEGLDETAGYLREAGKLVRKAARSARAAAREAVAVADETAG